MVDGHIEEALLLIGMEIHGQHTSNTCHAQQISNQLGADAYARFAFAVLSRPAEIRNHSIHRARTGPLSCVNHQEKLHQVVSIWEGGLNKDDILTSDALLKTNFKLTVGKTGHLHIAHRHIQVLANLLGKILSACAGEDNKRRFRIRHCYVNQKSYLLSCCKVTKKL